MLPYMKNADNYLNAVLNASEIKNKDVEISHNIEKVRQLSSKKFVSR